MSPTMAFLCSLALGVLPSVLFLGLLRGLRWMQDSALMGRASGTAGVTAREITLRDALRGVLDRDDDGRTDPPRRSFRP